MTRTPLAAIAAPTPLAIQSGQAHPVLSGQGPWNPVAAVPLTRGERGEPLEKLMTKNGSNARKARIRAHATKNGVSYRQAAREVDAERTQEKDPWAEWKASARSIMHNPEDLAEERTRYLEQMLAAELPDSVKACLFVLSDRLGTGTLIDTRGVSYTVPEVADLTGLTARAVEESLNLARAQGWIAWESTDHVRLSAPGEDVDMYASFLKQIKQPVRDDQLYSKVLERIEAEIAQQSCERAEHRAWL